MSTNKKSGLRQKLAKHTLFQGLVRTIADSKMIQVLTAMVTDNAIQENNRVCRIRGLRNLGTRPTFSFVKTISLVEYTDSTKSKLTHKGLGIFRCKQTGQLVERRFVPSSFVPNDITKQHRYSY